MTPGEFSRALQRLSAAGWRELDARAAQLERTGMEAVVAGDDPHSADTPALEGSAEVSAYGAAVAAKDVALSARWVELLPRLEPLWRFIQLHRHPGPGAALLRHAGEGLVLGEALESEHAGALLGAVEDVLARHGGF